MVNRTKMPFKARLLVVFLLIVGAAFLPITLVLFVGMLPSLIAFMVDMTRSKSLALTVTLMNFISCFPFLMDVAAGPMDLTIAYQTLMEPINVVIMFAGAGAGYFLDWSMAGMSNVIMISRARNRLNHIEKRHDELIRRWGKEVGGDVELDPDGFPLVDTGGD